MGRPIFRGRLQQVGELHRKIDAVADLPGAGRVGGSGLRVTHPVELPQENIKTVGEQLAPERRVLPRARQLLFRYRNEIGHGAYCTKTTIVASLPKSLHLYEQPIIAAVPEFIQQSQGYRRTYMAPADLPPIRRIVTGHDASGVAKVLIDGPAINARSSRPGSVSRLMWVTEEMPADISIGEGIEDMGARILGTPPPANGTRFTINDIPPGRPGRMHRTETIDYAIVLAGEIDMDMDDSTVKLKAGDVLIQRGTNHAWVNRGRETARIAFVLVDAKPLGIGHPRLREDSSKAE